MVQDSPKYHRAQEFYTRGESRVNLKSHLSLPSPHSLVNGAYKVDHIVGTIDEETGGHTIVGIGSFVNLKKIPSGHFNVTLRGITHRADVGKVYRCHLIRTSHIVHILMHPWVEYMLVLVITEIQHKIRCDQHKVGELVALAGIATTSKLVGEPTQTCARYQNLDRVQFTAS